MRNKMENSLLFIALFSSTYTVMSDRVYISPRVTDWGRWGAWEYCPSGSFVTGMQLLIHPAQGMFYDDRGLTGIRLFCNSYGGKSDGTPIQSSIDDVGNWGRKFFCAGVMTGFQMRSEPYRTTFVDDTASNNIRMFCDGSETQYQEGDGTSNGNWSASRVCAKDEVICGISTQIDMKDSWDRTGLNNVMMKCCSIPHPIGNCIPRTAWKLVASCDNPTKQDSKTCSYKTKLGMSYLSDLPASLYNSTGYGLKTLGGPLRAKFSNLSKDSNGTHEENQWHLSPNYVWEPEHSAPANLTATKGLRISLYQIQGTCGKLKVWGTKLKKMVYAKLHDHETKATTYINIDSHLNYVEYPHFNFV